MLAVDSAFYGCSLLSGTTVILFLNWALRTADLLLTLLKKEITVSDMIIYAIFGGSSIIGMIGIYLKIAFLLVPFMLLQMVCLVVMIILMITFPFAKESMLREFQIENEPKTTTTAIPTAVPTAVLTKTPTQVPTTAVSTAVPSHALTDVPILTVVVLEILMAIGCIAFFYTIVVVLSCFNEMRGKSK